MLHQKKILLGVTGGIAAYKTCDIVRKLTKLGAEVRVVMTEAAKEFVTSLTFETLSNHPVRSKLFGEKALSTPVHIELARWPQCVVICPATANIIGKVASGIADDLVSTLIMATSSPVIFCPAMNKQMYQNPVFRDNIRRLKALNYVFVEAEKGELACGEEGWGRLAEEGRIIDAIKRVLLTTEELRGQKVVVTAGRTEEPIDPVRIITNYSTGKMGFALAEAAALRGAEVTLISGPNHLEVFDGVNYRQVQTCQQMAEAVAKEFDSTDILIMAAAVADYRPKIYSAHKIKKEPKGLTISLEKTEDILHEAGRQKGSRLLVGFALETENVIANARTKLEQKNLDLIVLNNPLEEGAGFAQDTNRVTLIDRGGTVEELPRMSKREVAEKVMDKIVYLKKLLDQDR